jgi:hypothetical protein
MAQPATSPAFEMTPVLSGQGDGASLGSEGARASGGGIQPDAGYGGSATLQVAQEKTNEQHRSLFHSKILHTFVMFVISFTILYIWGPPCVCNYDEVADSYGGSGCLWKIALIAALASGLFLGLVGEW